MTQEEACRTGGEAQRVASAARGSAHTWIAAGTHTLWSLLGGRARGCKSCARRADVRADVRWQVACARWLRCRQSVEVGKKSSVLSEVRRGRFLRGRAARRARRVAHCSLAVATRSPRAPDSPKTQNSKSCAALSISHCTGPRRATAPCRGRAAVTPPHTPHTRTHTTHDIDIPGPPLLRSAELTNTSSHSTLADIDLDSCPTSSARGGTYFTATRAQSGSRPPPALGGERSRVLRWAQGADGGAAKRSHVSTRSTSPAPTAIRRSHMA